MVTSEDAKERMLEVCHFIHDCRYVLGKKRQDRCILQRDTKN